MKIVLLTNRDCAGSGSQLYKALQLEHDVSMFRRSNGNPFNHPLEGVVFKNKKEYSQIQKVIDQADIVHIKGDDPFFSGLKIPHKKAVITVSGTNFRREKYGGSPKFPLSAYKGFRKTAITADLCYEGVQWLPHAMKNGERLWKKSSPIVLVHSPTNRQKKNTDFIVRVFEKIKKIIPCDIDIVENVSFNEANERRKRATLFFDQALIGTYGKSGVEAMRYGIPVVAWISDRVRKVKEMKGCPVLSWPLDVSVWADEVVKILSTDMMDLSHRTTQWFDKTHSYKAILAKVNKIYN